MQLSTIENITEDNTVFHNARNRNYAIIKSNMKEKK